MTTINNNLQITWDRRQEIKQIARDTLNKYNITAPPAKPKKILMGIGELYGFSDPEEKGFTRYKKEEYSIYINNVEYKSMVAWTYAHELGHIVLDHFHLGYGYLSSDFDCELLDEEANIFAAEYLMQEDWVRKYVLLLPPSNAKNLGKLKALFKVSWASLINRLDNLRIQSKIISEAILNLHRNRQNKSRNTEFFDDLEDLYDEIGFAINDDRSCVISAEDFTSAITDISSLVTAKDLNYSGSETCIPPAEDEAEFSKCMFCGRELPWDNDNYCSQCGTLFINNTPPKLPKPIEHTSAFIVNTDDYERHEDETYNRNKSMLLSLEEAYLSPNDCLPRFYDYDDWPEYD